MSLITPAAVAPLNAAVSQSYATGSTRAAYQPLEFPANDLSWREWRNRGIQNNRLRVLPVDELTHDQLQGAIDFAPIATTSRPFSAEPQRDLHGAHRRGRGDRRRDGW